MQKFWGLDPSEDPVIKQIEYDKDMSKFYGAKDEAGSTQCNKKAQTREEIVNIFFAASEKDPSMSI